MTRMQIVIAVVLAAATVAVPTAHAHEVRPAYLEITQQASGRYAMLWRTPVLSGMRLPVVLRLPADAHDVREPTVQELTDSLVERRVIEAPDGLAGKPIQFVGLEATITDVLVRTALLDGTTSTTLVRPSRPWIDVAATGGTLAVASAYLGHGVEHILFGYDHLLFVLALMLIVASRRALLATVTAFTVAHSITLALAALDVVRLPTAPIEACIALSILLLACEIVRLERGEPSLTARRPWMVAFAFGLLHGFGFATALSSIGLPHGDVPMALASFNVGVELGQLAFISLVIGVAVTARRFQAIIALERPVLRAAPVAIGALAAFWLLDRLAMFSA